MTAARTLAAGLVVAVAALIVTHPVAVAGLLALAWTFARRTGALDRAPYLGRLAVGIALSVALVNVLFSWNGATELWRAPFRIALLGRPRLTLEALAWGALAGGQLATTVLAAGAATLTVAPESLHRALVAIGLPRSFALAGALGLRLAPDTARDAASMRRALHTRGLTTAGVRGAARVLVPLTARSLDRSHAAEEALVLRGYGGRAGDRPRPPLSVALVTLAALSVVGLFAWLGPLRPAYYPSLTIAWDAATLLLAVLALVLPWWLVKGVQGSSN